MVFDKISGEVGTLGVAEMLNRAAAKGVVRGARDSHRRPVLIEMPSLNEF